MVTTNNFRPYEKCLPIKLTFWDPLKLSLGNTLHLNDNPIQSFPWIPSCSNACFAVWFSMIFVDVLV